MTGELSRYRLYIDESGDHVFRDTDTPGHRYLCLLGCFIADGPYKQFHEELSALKQRHIPHNPDDPVILHREDVVNRRKAFWRLRDPAVREAFDRELLDLLKRTEFKMTAVVIDKHNLRDRYAEPAHPYHLALGFLMQRYCGYLNHTGHQGDIMAESRGGREDRLLKSSYEFVYSRGIWKARADVFKRALTSKRLKVKPKSANIAGLQLADMLAHAVKQQILTELNLNPAGLGPFAEKLLEATTEKFNRHLYDGRVWGYGKVFFPEAIK